MARSLGGGHFDMDGPEGRGPALSRRAALLAGVSATMLASCAQGAPPAPAPAVATPRPDGFSLFLPDRTFDRSVVSPSPTPTETPAAVQVRSAPAFTVHDLIPDAPKNAVALTIDDGPHPQWTPRVLDLLAHYKVLATFCLVGLEVRAFPDLVRSTVRAGHMVCNHTNTHPQPFNRLPADRLDVEIGSAQTIISTETGHLPKLFRAPGGAWSPLVFSAAARHGLIPIDWDIDPRDWSRPGTATIVRKLLAARPGDILLCHDGGGDRSETLAALAQVLPVLLARGYEFITLAPTVT
jgi:peptidoglycan/xylan/chitin deacetylase (PgdA/CDA1 family)